MPEPFRTLAPGTRGRGGAGPAAAPGRSRVRDALPVEAGAYGDSTAAAVRAFQTARGLRVDGICGRQTWSGLVEAGYRLGDRLLYHRTPMLRGDDVLDLQEKLNALGFDAGRGDGIFGPHTADALREFQRNVGAVIDGICGPESIAALERLSRFAGGSVASVREKEALRDGALRLAGRRVYLAVEPGLDALGEVVAKGLMELGADVLVDASGEDDSVVAAEANRYGADLFLGLRFGDIPGAVAATTSPRTPPGPRAAATSPTASARNWRRRSTTRRPNRPGGPTPCSGRPGCPPSSASPSRPTTSKGSATSSSGPAPPGGPSSTASSGGSRNRSEPGPAQTVQSGRLAGIPTRRGQRSSPRIFSSTTNDASGPPPASAARSPSSSRPVDRPRAGARRSSPPGGSLTTSRPPGRRKPTAHSAVTGGGPNERATTASNASRRSARRAASSARASTT